MRQQHLVHFNRSERLHLKHFFFERTTLDECVFIDIAEKYKTTVLGGHRQETKRKENNKLVRLDWDVNTGYRSTILTGRLDWDINTTKL